VRAACAYLTKFIGILEFKLRYKFLEAYKIYDWQYKWLKIYFDIWLASKRESYEGLIKRDDFSDVVWSAYEHQVYVLGVKPELQRYENYFLQGFNISDSRRITNAKPGYPGYVEMYSTKSVMLVV